MLSRLSARSVLPVVLLTAASGAFAGLAAMPSAGDGDRAPDVLAVAEPLTPGPLRAELLVLREDDLDKASRSRARRPSPLPRPVAPAVKVVKVVKPQPVVAPPPPPRRKPTPTATRKPRPKPTARAIARAVAPVASSRSNGRCPVPSASFTDTYGAPRSGGRSHEGTDLLAPLGAPVYAVAAGVVDTTSSSNGGISLYLRSSNGERYFYAHNSQNVARDGQRVQAGDLIARVGSTGNAGSTNHVHFEREVGGVSVNPYDFLRRIC